VPELLLMMDICLKQVAAVLRDIPVIKLHVITLFMLKKTPYFFSFD